MHFTYTQCIIYVGCRSEQGIVAIDTHAAKCSMTGFVFTYDEFLMNDKRYYLTHKSQ